VVSLVPQNGFIELEQSRIIRAGQAGVGRRRWRGSMRLADDAGSTETAFQARLTRRGGNYNENDPQGFARGGVRRVGNHRLK